MPAWGKQSPRLPVTEVRPGHLEFAVLQQDQVTLGGINFYFDTVKSEGFAGICPNFCEETTVKCLYSKAKILFNRFSKCER